MEQASGVSGSYLRPTKFIDAYDNETRYLYGQGGAADRKLQTIQHPDGTDEVFNYEPDWITTGPWSDNHHSGIETSLVVRATGQVLSRKQMLFKRRMVVNGAGQTVTLPWTRPYKGDLLYRVYHEPRAILPDLSSPGALETYAIPASLDAPLRIQVVEYAYEPGTALVTSISQFTCDDIAGSNPSEPLPCLSYAYGTRGGRARVIQEIQHQKRLEFSYDYTFHPGGYLGELAVATITCTNQDGASVVKQLDEQQRIISETLYPATGSSFAGRANDPDAGSEVEPPAIVVNYEYNYTGSQLTCVCGDRPTAEINVTSGRRVDYHYDTLTGLLLELRLPNPSGASQPAISAFAYSPVVAGDLYGAYKRVSATDAAGHTTTYSYTSVPRPNGWGGKHQTITVSLPPVVGASGGGATLLTSVETHDVSSPDFTSGSQRRLVGQVLSSVDSDGVVQSMSYDSAGRPASVVTNPGGGALEIVSTTIFDARGSLTNVIQNGGAANPYEVAIDNDPVGRPTRISSTVGGVPQETRYYYDRWDNQCVVLRRNKTSSGSAPDDFGPSPRSEVAREWLQDELHYDGQRLVVALSDRRPLDRNASGPLADDPAGNGRFLRTVYLWSPTGQLAEVGQSNGSVSRFAYDGYGSLYRTEHSSPGQQSIVSRWFINSALESVRRIDGIGAKTATTRLARNGAGTISRIAEPVSTAPLGYPTGWSVASAVYEFTTDVMGRTVESRAYADLGGSTSLLLRRHTTFDELGRERLAEVFEGGASVPTQAFAMQWKNATRLARVDGAAGRYLEQTFDALGRVSERHDCRDATNPNKVVYEYEPGAGYLKRASAMAWDETAGSGGYVTRVTEYVRDSLGRVQELKEFGSGSVPLVYQFAYYTTGQTESYTDPSGRVEEYLPDALGRLVERFRPQGEAIWNGTAYLDWTNTGNRTEQCQIDGLGHLTKTIFDFAGRVEVVMEPGCVAEPSVGNPNQPFSSWIRYDALSQMSDIYSGDDARMTFARDGAGRVIGRSITSGNEHVSPWHSGDWVERNALGQVTRTQSLLGFGLGAYVNEERLEDALGRVHRESFQYLFDPTTWVNIDSAYDTALVGDPVRRGLSYQIGAGGSSSDLWIQHIPGAVGRMRAIKWRAGSAATLTPLADYLHEGSAIRSRQTSFPLGGVTPGSFTTTYSYDDYGRMSGISHSFSTAASVAFHYDASSNLIKEVYEKQGQPGVVGEGDRFAYDEHNRLVTAWLGSDALALGAVSPATPDTTGTFVKRLTYGLDEANNRIEVGTLPSGGVVAKEDYSLQENVGGQGPSNRYEVAGDTKLWYDDRGNLIFNGEKYFVYDGNRRLTEVYAVAQSAQQLQGGGGSIGASASAGQLASAESTTAPSEPARFLVEDVTALRHARSMIMGRVGSNLLTVLASNEQSPIAAQLKEPLGAGVVQAGGGSGEGGAAAGMQMGAAYTGMAPSAEGLNLILEALYLYDYSDRRVVRWLLVEPTPRYYAYDGWEEVEELQLGRGVIKQFVWGEQLDELVAFRVKDDNGAWDSYYVAEGGAHCPSRILDAGGGVAEIQEYDPYGATSFFRASGTYLGTESYVGNPFGWKGHRIDPETGLVYMRHRFFAPRMGRFVSQDPLGIWSDATCLGNAYAYCGDNPLNSSDPLGLQTVQIGKISVGMEDLFLLSNQEIDAALATDNQIAYDEMRQAFQERAKSDGRMAKWIEEENRYIQEGLADWYKDIVISEAAGVMAISICGKVFKFAVRGMEAASAAARARVNALVKKLADSIGRREAAAKAAAAKARQTGAGGLGEAADAAYDAIRASKTDVATIAKNTGIKAENIQKVKDHVFNREHLLDKYVGLGEPARLARFDSDAKIAGAWKRLESGTFTAADKELLKHEAAEAWYMKRYGPGYSSAHEAAQARFPAPGH